MNQADKIISFIRRTFKQQQFSRAIVAVSGGVDSATSLMLTVKALGKKNIYSLQLPYKKHQSLELSDLAIEQTGIPKNQRLIINIGRAADKIAAKLNAKKDKVRLGNIIARVRMICLFDQAKKLKALVVGTENKSEKMLGYFTRFGDEASDVEPIIHLYKTEVIKLAQELGVPEAIIQAAPTAGLWPGQTDETELGMTYAEIDAQLKQGEIKPSFKLNTPYHL
jgi:NAD+ synthase